MNKSKKFPSCNNDHEGIEEGTEASRTLFLKTICDLGGSLFFCDGYTADPRS